MKENKITQIEYYAMIGAYRIDELEYAIRILGSSEETLKKLREMSVIGIKIQDAVKRLK